MDVLGSRILLRPREPARSRRFYRETLGLAVSREFGSPDDPGLVFFLGGGFLEVSGRSADGPGDGVAIWIQVRDVEAEHGRLLAAGVPVVDDLPVWTAGMVRLRANWVSERGATPAQPTGSAPS
jgi:catechol 2,3-dioxygenase-like lactoylglutathione lyase family enzyme